MPYKNIEVRRQKRREQYYRDVVKTRAYKREWARAHPDGRRRWADANRVSQRPKRREISRRYRQGHLEMVKARGRVSNLGRYYRIRAEFLEAYGGRCSCCGESEPRFLTIEHLRGDGEIHRRSLGRGIGRGRASAVYQDLKRRGWPKDGYTIMCWNCNMARRFGRGCPHQERAEAIGGF
mgnify:FL=1